FTVYNRSQEKGLTLANLINGRYLPLEQLYKKTSYDVIISCTSANKILFGKEGFDQIPLEKKTLLVDLAVPPNIDRTHVHLYQNLRIIGIEELKALADKNLKFRKQEVSLAKTIIEEEVDHFHKRYLQRQIEIALNSLPQEIQNIKDKIVQEVFIEKIEKFNPEQKIILNEILEYMQDKCTAAPMKIAKNIIQ
ncbi:MAG: glutamyl-tRNA reductase, partial [Bacteroidota bacterium]